VVQEVAILFQHSALLRKRRAAEWTQVKLLEFTNSQFYTTFVSTLSVSSMCR
jgi:hypothetical protein